MFASPLNISSVLRSKIKTNVKKKPPLFSAFPIMQLLYPLTTGDLSSCHRCASHQCWIIPGSDLEVIFETSIAFPSTLWREVAVSSGRVLHLPTCGTQKHTSLLRCQGLERAAKSDSNSCRSSVSSPCSTRFYQSRDGSWAREGRL